MNPDNPNFRPNLIEKDLNEAFVALGHLEELLRGIASPNDRELSYIEIINRVLNAGVAAIRRDPLWTQAYFSARTEFNGPEQTSSFREKD